MSEFQKMILTICFLVSLFSMMVFYIFAKQGYFFEMCRDDECRIYKVKIVEEEK